MKNPSRWPKRIIISLAATLGLLIALYLAFYQWGAYNTIWDPFFRDPTGKWPNGSAHILHSAIARSLPIPDAFLGALAYLAEIILDLAGGRHRWRRRPWLVLLFGLCVIGLGFVSLLLLIAQVAIFRVFCFLCLCSAAISLTIFLPALEEPLASLVFILRARRAGASIWSLLWRGDSQLDR